LTAFVPEGIVVNPPNVSIVPNIAHSFYEPNHNVIATGTFRPDTPLSQRRTLARHVQAGDSIWLVFACSETIGAGDFVTVNGTISFAVTYEVNSQSLHFH
jgi:hypothetical protein